MLPKSPKSHHVATASQCGLTAAPTSPSAFPRGSNTYLCAVDWAVPLCADGSIFVSLVKYLQVSTLMCRRYRALYCASIGITVINSGLKLEESLWWWKAQHSRTASHRSSNLLVFFQMVFKHLRWAYMKSWSMLAKYERVGQGTWCFEATAVVSGPHSTSYLQWLCLLSLSEMKLE